MKYDVVVLGSINLDIKSFIATFPNYGETAKAKSVEMIPGGKGANQAVAVSKLGGKIAFVGAVGEDSAGKQMIENLSKNKIDTQLIKRNADEGTGTFIVLVDDMGENTMVGTLGANSTLTSKDVTIAMENIDAPVMLLQMETSKESVETALKLAKKKKMFVILDPAPAADFFESALSYADCVTPNQQETERITGISVNNEEDAKKAAEIISNKGPKNVIIKMGSKGNLLYMEGSTHFIPALKVETVDTVGAGDTFAGALAAHYAKHINLLEAVEFANKAAAIKVSRKGGQEAIPSLEEVNNQNVFS